MEPRGGRSTGRRVSQGEGRGLREWGGEGGRRGKEEDRNRREERRTARVFVHGTPQGSLHGESQGISWKIIKATARNRLREGETLPEVTERKPCELRSLLPGPAPEKQITPALEELAPSLAGVTPKSVRC